MESLCSGVLTIEEQVEHYSKKIKTLFNNYTNLTESEDPVEISVIRDANRLVYSLLDEINLLRADVERLSTRKEVIKCGECRHWDISGYCRLLSRPKTYGGFCDEAMY